MGVDFKTQSLKVIKRILIEKLYLLKKNQPSIYNNIAKFILELEKKTLKEDRLEKILMFYTFRDYLSCLITFMS